MGKKEDISENLETKRNFVFCKSCKWLYWNKEAECYNCNHSNNTITDLIKTWYEIKSEKTYLKPPEVINFDNLCEWFEFASVSGQHYDDKECVKDQGSWDWGIG